MFACVNSFFLAVGIISILVSACSTKSGEQTGVEAGNAKIAGLLQDSLRNPIGNAVIRMQTIAKRTQAVDTTDAEGRFEFAGLPSGEYTMLVEFENTIWTKPEILVGNSDQPIEMEVSLNRECVDVVIWIGGTMIAFLCEGSTWGQDSIYTGEDTLGFWDTIPISSWCDVPGNCGAFSDSRDHREYRWSRIGGFYWLAQNVDFRGGVVGNSFCYNDSSYYCDRYGRLYDWSAAQEACPLGWRIPTWQDWIKLIDSVGGKEVAAEGFKLETFWPQEPGGDAFGFAAYPAGSRGEVYGGSGEYAMWWLNDSQYPESNGSHVMYLERNSIGLIDTYQADHSAHSLRCIYSGSIPP